MTIEQLEPPQKPRQGTSIDLTCAQRPLQVNRDAAGVPHLRADNWHDALYGLGYLHAFDRPTQLVFGRIAGRGQLCEKVADTPKTLAVDRLFRQAGLYVGLEAEVQAMPSEELTCLRAYCAGVNDGFRQKGRSLPMWLTGVTPEPWTPEDVLLLGNLLTFSGLAMGQQRSERMLIELVRAGVDRELLRYLYQPFLDHADFDLVLDVKLDDQISDEALKGLEQLPSLRGSNAWAVAAGRSATGTALLASDMHLEIGHLPATWYEAVLQWDEDKYLMGATLPGAPLFSVGRTKYLSWGVTYSMGDVSDYFVEDCRIREDKVQYRRDEEWFDFEVRQETITRKQEPAEYLSFYSNEVGVLVGDPQTNGKYLSLCWSGHKASISEAVSTWLHLADCPNAEEAMEIVRVCPQPPLVWMFADSQGQIGQQLSGYFPQRPAHANGLFPLPAWDTNNHWQGRRDPNILPGILNPPEGILVHCNQDINLPDEPNLVTLPEASYRHDRIRQLLESHETISVEDCQQIQYDVVNSQAKEILDEFELPAPLAEALRDWDASYPANSTQATQFHAFFEALVLEVLGREVSAGGLGRSRLQYILARPVCTLLLLSRLQGKLLDPAAPWWQQLDRQHVITAAHQASWQEESLPWGEVNWIDLENQFIPGQIGSWLGFHVPKVAVQGCQTTPHQGFVTHTGHGRNSFCPSYHFVTQMGTDQIHTNLPGGPSESRFSRWYLSDLPHWSQGTYKTVEV